MKYNQFFSVLFVVNHYYLGSKKLLLKLYIYVKPYLQVVYLKVIYVLSFVIVRFSIIHVVC